MEDDDFAEFGSSWCGEFPGACAQFAPHSNVKGDQFAIREPKVAHNRVFAAESELVLRVTRE